MGVGSHHPPYEPPYEPSIHLHPPAVPRRPLCRRLEKVEVRHINHFDLELLAIGDQK